MADDKQNSILDFATKSADKISGTVVDEMEKTLGLFAKLAEKGTIVFLLAVGATLVALTLILKGRFSTSEFLVAMGVGVMLILCGAGYDFCAYRWKVQDHFEKRLAQQEKDRLASQIAQTGIRTVAELAQTVSTTSKAIAENLQKKTELETFPDSR